MLTLCQYYIWPFRYTLSYISLYTHDSPVAEILLSETYKGILRVRKINCAQSHNSNTDWIQVYLSPGPSLFLWNIGIPHYKPLAISFPCPIHLPLFLPLPYTHPLFSNHNEILSPQPIWTPITQLGFLFFFLIFGHITQHVPQSEIKSKFLALEVWSLNHWTTEEVLPSILSISCFLQVEFSSPSSLPAILLLILHILA